MVRLADILANRTWLRRNEPFFHVLARDVFTQRFYASVASEYMQILGRRLYEGANGHGEKFSRSIAGYDAYGMGFNQSIKGSLAVFSSPEWQGLMAGLFEVAATGHINVGAHHHVLGSASGWIHNDFNPVWFPRDSNGPIRYPDHRLCAYKTGAGPLPASKKIQVVRAVAMIFYLANDGWIEGDGGETGLYDSRTASAADAHTRVQPYNNSILLFECTPDSYHTFLANPRRARNSIIMWIHHSKEDAIARWPEHELETWKF
jgi:hypothetical protein